MALNGTPPNPNARNNVLIDLLSSDLSKAIIAVIFAVTSASYSMISATNEIQKSLAEVNHKIELQNQKMEYRLIQIENRQERDSRYFSENYVKKIEIMNLKVK